MDNIDLAHNVLKHNGLKQTAFSSEIIPDNSLIDSHGRIIDYLRLSVTERCNLRCSYCMPEEGIRLKPRSEILTWEEIARVVGIFTDLGISRLRITGGEPFIRKGLPRFLESISGNPKLKGIFVTTNGTELPKSINGLQRMNIAGINLSIDSVSPDLYRRIAGKNKLDSALNAFQFILDSGIRLKTNTVLNKFLNESEIIKIAELARTNPVDVRFIEEMPFGGNSNSFKPKLSADDVINLFDRHYNITPVSRKDNSTAALYKVDGFAGRIGVIAGYSRTFCSGCNRIRITADGQLKNCLYGGRVLDIRNLLRGGHDDCEIQNSIIEAVSGKLEDGFAASRQIKSHPSESMSLIGG